MTTSRKSMLLSTFATLLSLVVITRPSAAQSYNAAADFSTGSNPNGAWSYGSSISLGSAFIPSSIPTNGYVAVGLDGWLGSATGSGVPYVLHNGTAHNITNNFSVYQPGQLLQQPGGLGQYSIVRWTAPFSGTFSINATFSGLSLLGDSADVHILLDGISIFNFTVIGSPSPASYSGSGSLTAGDRIDFVVGDAGNGANEDNTALSATIVPEPATLALVGMGLGCLLSFRFFKR
jgi:PEP-CTERM motif